LAEIMEIRESVATQRKSEKLWKWEGKSLEMGRNHRNYRNSNILKEFQKSKTWAEIIEMRRKHRNHRPGQELQN